MLHARRRSRGFTLVELLVVIGIISLLISMLLPALNKARDAANATQCMGNMRQIGMAVALYTNEYKNKWLPPYRFPEATDYYPATLSGAPYFVQWIPAKYFKEDPRVLFCPSDEDVKNRGVTPRMYSGIRDTNTSFYMNFDLPRAIGAMYPAPYNHPYFNPHTLKGIKQPAQTVIFGENAKGGWSVSARSLRDRFRFDHRRRTSQTICFADGHVDMVTEYDLLPRLQYGETNNYNTWDGRLKQLWFGSPDAKGIPLYTW